MFTCLKDCVRLLRNGRWRSSCVKAEVPAPHNLRFIEAVLSSGHLAKLLMRHLSRASMKKNGSFSKSQNFIRSGKNLEPSDSGPCALSSLIRTRLVLLPRQECTQTAELVTRARFVEISHHQEVIANHISILAVQFAGLAWKTVSLLARADDR